MPLFWISIVFIIGAVLGMILEINVTVLIILSCLNILIIVWNPRFIRILFNKFSFKPEGRFLTVLLSVMLIAASWAGFRKPEINPGFIAWYNNQENKSIVRGVIIEEPKTFDDYQRLLIEVESLSKTGEPGRQDVSGKLILYADLDRYYQYGDLIAAEGYLSTPAEGSSYQKHLASQNIFSKMSYAEVTFFEAGHGSSFKAAIISIRASFRDTLERIFPSPESSLLVGILLGDESRISDELYGDFRKAGAAHVIVISGFNIAIVASVLIWLFGKRVNRGLGLAFAVIGIGFYTLLTGADPSVIRAAIMGVLGLAANQLGRRQVGLNSLGIAALVMVILQPAVVLNIGFQLSFLATLGLIVFSEPLESAASVVIQRWLPEQHHSKILNFTSEYFLYTLAANIMVLPVLVYYFGRLSWVLLPVNLLILPVQSIIMIGGMLALIAGIFLPPAGQLIGYLPWFCTKYMIAVVEFFAGLRGSEWLIDLSLSGLAAVYACIFAISYWWKKVRGIIQNIGIGWAAIGLCAAAVLTLNAGLFRTDQRLQIAFMNTGMGSSILIKTPENRYVLIGGGSDRNRLSDALGGKMAFLNTKIDHWMIANNHEDNLRAFSQIIDRYNPDSVLWASELDGTKYIREMRAAWEQDGYETIFIEPGQRLDLGNGAYLEVVFICRNGAVIHLVYDDFDFVLPLGLDFESLPDLVEYLQVMKSDLYLLADSGFEPLNPEHLLAEIDPIAWIIEVSPEAGINRPSAAVLANLNGENIIRTDLDGWIMVSTDGNKIWIETQNNH